MAESELVQVEPQTSLLIANENGDSAEAEVGILAVRMKAAPVRQKRGRVSGGHLRKYILEAMPRVLRDHHFCRGSLREKGRSFAALRSVQFCSRVQHLLLSSTAITHLAVNS